MGRDLLEAQSLWLALPEGFIVIDLKCRTTLEQQTLSLFFLLIPLTPFALRRLPVPNDLLASAWNGQHRVEGAGAPLNNAVPTLVCCTVIPVLTQHRKT